MRGLAVPWFSNICNRRKALADALGVLDGRDRRIFEGRRLSGDPITLAELTNLYL